MNLARLHCFSLFNRSHCVPATGKSHFFNSHNKMFFLFFFKGVAKKKIQHKLLGSKTVCLFQNQICINLTPWKNQLPKKARSNTSLALSSLIFLN